MGKTVKPDGTVDHASTPRTPHLTLGIVWYEFEMTGRYDWVKTDGLLDVIGAVSPWVWNQRSATTTPAAYTKVLADLRSYIGPTMPVLPGVYIKNSAVGWIEPAAVANLITQTVELYDAGVNFPAIILFAGVWFEADLMNKTLFDSLGFDELLGRTYYPFVGTATVTVVGAEDKKPVAGAEVVVTYGGSKTFVTRKVTDVLGRVGVSGWCGRAAPTQHTVQVTAPGGGGKVVALQLKPQASVELTVSIKSAETPSTAGNVSSCPGGNGKAAASITYACAYVLDQGDQARCDSFANRSCLWTPNPLAPGFGACQASGHCIRQCDGWCGGFGSGNACEEERACEWKEATDRTYHCICKAHEHAV